MKDETFVEDDFTYTVVNEQATLTRYDGHKKKLTIPTTLGGYAATSIGKKAFDGCSSLTEVIISNSVTSIGDSAFWG